MLGSALQLVLQSIVTLVLILALTSWAVAGSLSRILQLYSNSGVQGLLQDPSSSLTVIAVLLIVPVAVIIVALVGAGFVYSSEYGTYFEAWNKESVSVKSVLENGSRTWKAMTWTFFLSNTITWGPAAIGLLLVLSSLSTVSTVSGAIFLLGTSLAFVALLIVSLILATFTVYAYSAVIIDHASGLGAIRSSFRIAGNNLGSTLGYAFVRIFFQVLLLLVAQLAGSIGLPLTSLVAVVLSFVLTPILHLTKTMIFYHGKPTVAEMRYRVYDPVWQDIFRRLPKAVWRKIRTGLAEGSRFVITPSNLPFHALSVLAFSLGIYLGYFVSINGVAGYFLSLGYQPGHGNSLLARLPFPALPALGIDIFLNNWLVSIATGLSGLGFAAPSFLTIMFNGFILGILLAPTLSPSLTMFLAAILPHGIIEIPAFVLSGSAGIRLGYAALKARIHPGLESGEYLAKTLRLTVYVVIGLAPLFLVAGLIEADITPIIMRMFGWVF